MLRPLVVIGMILSFGPSVMAQESASTIDLAAAAIFGVADGSIVPMGPAPATAEQIEPGHYLMTMEGGPIINMVFDEKEPCVFTADILVADVLQGSVRIDASQLTSVNYLFRRKERGMNQYGFLLKGPPSMMEQLSPQGQATPMPNSSFLSTSLELESLQSAATQLIGRCAG